MQDDRDPQGIPEVPSDAQTLSVSGGSAQGSTDGSVGESTEEGVLAIDAAIAQAVVEVKQERGISADTPEAVRLSNEDAQIAENSVAGLGVDIVEIERMAAVLERTPHFKERVFTEAERAYCEDKASPAVHYALRFAAREAVLKALGTGFTGVCLDDVEVTNDRYGRPIPLLHGRAAERAAAKGVVEIHLSLSYTHTVGVASAVAITEAARPRVEEKEDPYEELARQFKELRGMIDDIDEKLREIELSAEAAAELPTVDDAETFGTPESLETSGTPEASEALEVSLREGGRAVDLIVDDATVDTGTAATGTIGLISTEVPAAGLPTSEAPMPKL